MIFLVGLPNLLMVLPLAVGVVWLLSFVAEQAGEGLWRR